MRPVHAEQGAGVLVPSRPSQAGPDQLDSTHETQVHLLSEAKQLAQGVQAEVSVGKARDSLVGLRIAISVLTPPFQLQGGTALAVALR